MKRFWINSVCLLIGIVLGAGCFYFSFYPLKQERTGAVSSPSYFKKIGDYVFPVVSTWKVGSSTTDSVWDELTISSVATPAGTFLAADGTGLVIATTSGGWDALSDIPLDAGYMLVGNPSNLASATSSLFISQTGNVGVGTTTPNSPLQVSEYINFNPLIKLTAVGYQTGLHTTANYNTYFGHQAGMGSASSTNSLGTCNVAVGYQAMYNNIRGYDNTAIGDNALRQGTSGYLNSAVGASAIRNNTTGAHNTGMGFYTLYYNITGSRNVVFGNFAGKYETGSDAFYINNQDRTDTAGDKTKSLLYGTFAALSADQNLAINAHLNVTGTSTFSNLATFGNASTTQLTVSSTLYLGTGTTTASNGFDISAGCYAVGGTCLTSGTTYTATWPLNITGTVFSSATSSASSAGVLSAANWTTFNNKWDLASTTIGVAYGGTGATTLTDHGVLVGSGAGAITPLSVGTNGQLLVGSTGADPVFATLNCADGLTCTIGAGTLEIDFDGGNTPGGSLGGTWASPTVDSDETWTLHNSYPTACATGIVTGIGDTLTCTATSTLLINTDNLVQGTSNLFNQTHTGEVTGATGLTIADNVVDEANLKMSTSPTNNFLLIASSTASGGMDWVATSSPLLGLGTGGGGGWDSLSDISLDAGYMIVGNPSNVASATSSLFISQAGSVGIGTTTPRWPNGLVIQHSTQPLIELSDANGNVGQLYVSGSNTYLEASTDNHLFLLAGAGITNGSGKDIELYGGNGNGTGVGGDVIIYGGTGGSTNANGGTVSLIFGSGGGSGNDGDITFQPSTWVGDQSMIFKGQTGRLGIGTTSPYAKLSVWGAGITTGQTFELVNNASTSLMKVLDNGTITMGSSTNATTTISGNFDMAGSAVRILGEYFTNFTNKIIAVIQGAASVVLTGAWDFGGATSVEIPNGAPTVDTTGEIGIDTTTGQFKWSYNGASLGVVVPFYTTGFSYATSTSWSATTTIYFAPAMANLTFKGVYCETNTGTLGMSLYDGTNRANYMATASTTKNYFAYSTNNTFTAGESIRIDVGTPATSPTKIACRFKFTYDQD